MPSQASSSDSNDLASKYSHLLQPIRDLTKNWDIDVAAQLEEYLAEVRINWCIKAMIKAERKSI